MSERKDGFMGAAARYMATATTLPAAILAGYGIGYFLDKSFQTTYLKVVFLILGIAAGFVELIRQLMRDMKSK